MDAMVSARIGVEKRDKANAILKEIGSTPTRLINAAYDYLIEAGELPDAYAGKPRPRNLSTEALASLRKSIEATTTAVPDNYFAGKTDKDLLASGLQSKYGIRAAQ